MISKKVTEVRDLASLVLDLQNERAAIALSLYMSLVTGEKTDLTKSFSKTDATLQKVKWTQFGPEKIFTTKLRFQIKLDDFRSDNMILNFKYNLSS